MVAVTFWLNGCPGYLVAMTGFVLFERFGSFSLHLLKLIFNADLKVFWALLVDCCLSFVFSQRQLLFVGL